MPAASRGVSNLVGLLANCSPAFLDKTILTQFRGPFSIDDPQPSVNRTTGIRRRPFSCLKRIIVFQNVNGWTEKLDVLVPSIDQVLPKPSDLTDPVKRTVRVGVEDGVLFIQFSTTLRITEVERRSPTRARIMHSGQDSISNRR